MKALLDVLLPPACPGCGREGAAVCSECLPHLARRRDEPQGAPIGLAVSQPAGLVQLEWCCAYSGPARACLHALKYDGELRLVDVLAEQVAARWARAGIGGDILVPVPVHAARLRQRGFDQAELLARAVGRVLKLPVATALERAAKTAAQHALSRRARAANVGGAFVVKLASRDLVDGRWVVLIDDVVTTGATFSGCAHALYEAGSSAVSALALCRER
ncbi:MAG: ComF family protein [Chloroflexota bacterium]